MGFVEFDYSVTLSQQLPVSDNSLFDDLLSRYRDRIQPGWSLNPHALRAALWSLEQQASPEKVLRAVEFGSGVSSLFLVQYFGDRLQLTSYEHDAEWANSLQRHDPRLEVTLRPLLRFSQSDFQEWCSGRIAEWNVMRTLGEEVPEEQKHDFGIPFAFYAIEAGELPPADLYIVDGPHGHGRSISYRLIAKAQPGNCNVLIDDANHYTFLHDASAAFGFNVLHGEFLPKRGSTGCLNLVVLHKWAVAWVEFVEVRADVWEGRVKGVTHVDRLGGGGDGVGGIE